MKYVRNSIVGHDESTTGTRINKFLSEAGFCSRREADRLVGEGKVLIDGRIALMGEKIFPNQKVEVENQVISLEEELVYIAYNKPSGVTCTTDRSVYRNIIEAVKHPMRVFPIGRLDKLSTGLIFLTNDGEIVNKILRAGNNHEKEYLVTVDKPIDESFVEEMSNGIPVLNTITKKCFVKKETETMFRIILTQGLNRQIRRMCEFLGYEVTSLERIRIMNVALGNLKPGKWKNLTPKELSEINRLIRDSKKTSFADAHSDNELADDHSDADSDTDGEDQ